MHERLTAMKIFDHFQHINLTNDQRNALERLHAFLESDERVFILQGYAGSGKTTLLKGFVEYIKSLEKKYQLMAPTGRAAKVINQKQALNLPPSTKVFTTLMNCRKSNRVKTKMMFRFCTNTKSETIRRFMIRF